MKKSKQIWSLCLFFIIVFASHSVLAETRAYYLSKIGVPHQKIQSIKNVEKRVLEKLKRSNAAVMTYRRTRSSKDIAQAQKLRRQLQHLATLYNRALKRHLNRQQLISYISYLNRSNEVIYISGGIYSPYVLTPLIAL